VGGWRPCPSYEQQVEGTVEKGRKILRKKPTGEGYTMDINALNELIARARETVASVVQAEQRVAACTAELAAQPEIKVAPARSIGSIPKRVSGWVPTTEKLPKAS
jgi:hypothetical protein